jgi:hypothetical protein
MARWIDTPDQFSFQVSAGGRFVLDGNYARWTSWDGELTVVPGGNRSPAIEMWKCGNARHLCVTNGCWTADHISYAAVKLHAAGCFHTCVCWRHAVVNYVEKKKESENVNRDEVIRGRIRELEDELARRGRYGADVYDVGTVLSWDKTYADNDTTYRYVAIKTTVTRWFITGVTASNNVTWDKLVELWSGGLAVESVRVATAWRDITVRDEATGDAK